MLKNLETVQVDLELNRAISLLLARAAERNFDWGRGGEGVGATDRRWRQVLGKSGGFLRGVFDVYFCTFRQ